MTIVAGWIRTTAKGAQELIMASDSRLNGGGNLDSVPKLFLLPRSDCVLGFAGSTLLAYPLLTQISQSITFHAPLRDRVIDYVPLRTHIVKLINDLFSQYRTYDSDLQCPNTEFLLGGYSWFKKSFQLDKIRYIEKKKRFEHSNYTKAPDKVSYAFIGDWSQTFGRRLAKRIYAQSISGLQLEPFELIRDQLRNSGENDTIGGAPQIVSVSQHMNSNHTAVYWPTKASGTVFLGGRQMLPFENFDNWILDPDTLEKSHRHFGKVT